MAKNVTVTITKAANSSDSITAGTGLPWKIPSDGLEDLGTASESLSLVDFASSFGGTLQGAHYGTVDRTIKLIRYDDVDGTARRAAEEAFALGFLYTVSVVYKDVRRTFTGYLSNIKASSGNVYEPLELTLTFMCEDPFLSGGTTNYRLRKGSSSGTYTTGFISYNGTAPSNPTFSLVVEAVPSTVPTATETKSIDIYLRAYRSLSGSAAESADSYASPADITFRAVPFVFQSGQESAQTRVTLGREGGGLSLKIETRSILSSGSTAWITVQNPYQFLKTLGTGLRGMPVPPKWVMTGYVSMKTSDASYEYGLYSGTVSVTQRYIGV